MKSLLAVSAERLLLDRLAAPYWSAGVEMRRNLDRIRAGRSGFGFDPSGHLEQIDAALGTRGILCDT